MEVKMDASATHKIRSKKNETARQKFVRLANKRVVKAIKAVQLLGNLSNPAYEYDEKDVTKIFKAIQAEVDQARSKFSTREKAGAVFSLE
jgi:DNA polymerase IIIc chi subunit